MESIYVLTEEWFDIIYLENNVARRKINNDKGSYTRENNKLIIKWTQWGNEIFHNFDNIYYKLNKDNCLKIYIEEDDLIDYVHIDPNKREFRLLNYNLKGNYFFNQFILNLKFTSSKKYVEYYSMNYGRYFSNSNRTKNNTDKTAKDIKNIAIMFPQYHEVKENNEFWGEGFTEWTLLKRTPKIVGGQIIKQPYEEMGYYNLTNKDHRLYIESLVNHYNIYGFCYYHYWFKNKKVMYEPLELMLKDGKPDTKFMFCWANEQWTKKWDGGDNGILLEQDYSDQSGNETHFYYLLDFFKHKNYIKIENKPVFIFYRIEEKDINHIENIIVLWTKLAKLNGFTGIYFMRFLGPFNNDIKIRGLSGYVNFEPGNICQKYYKDIVSYDEKNTIFKNNTYDEELYLKKNPDIQKLIDNKEFNNGHEHYNKIKGSKEEKVRTSKYFIFDGSKALDKIAESPKEYDVQHKGIFCGWNNTPRRNYTSDNYSAYPHYYKNITLEKFESTYDLLLKNINKTSNKGTDFLFISAWNEWNEQAILEPNNIDGYNYLNAISNTYINFYNKKCNKNILNFCHKGGGTEKYMDDLKILFPLYNFIHFENYDDKKKYEEIYTNIDFIHINSLYLNNLIDSYKDFFNNNFKETKKIITIHDYQWLYPNNPNILSYEFNKDNIEKINIENILYLFSICTYIIFPSYNILKNYNQVLNLGKFNDKMKVIYHNDIMVYNSNLHVPEVKCEINISFIGHFISYKGATLFKKMYNKYKVYRNYKIKYHIFGYVSEEETKNTIDDENFIYYDSYNDENIIDILNKNNIHGITHLSLFEESYCYALSNSINSGRPILYLEHGVFVERLKNEKKYFHTNLSNFNCNYELFLDFIIENNSKKNMEEMNLKIQPKKWYLMNYK